MRTALLLVLCALFTSACCIPCFKAEWEHRRQTKAAAK